MTTFVEWFPLPMEFDTVLMFGVTLVLVMAGTIVGIIVKELEVFNPNNNPTKFNLFSDENKMFMLLGGGLSFGFWIANIPAVECFFYSTVMKAGLGTLRNFIDKKRNGIARPVIMDRDKEIAEVEARIDALQAEA